MRITAEATRFHRFAFRFRYNAAAVSWCRELSNRAHWTNFGWSSEVGAWCFSSEGIGREIVDRFGLPTDDLPQAFQAYGRARDAAKEKAAAMEKERMRAFWLECSPFRIDNIRGELYGYQKAAVVWLIRNNGRGLLAIDPGGGKSFVALAYAAHTGKRKVLVVCPASVKMAWEKETEKWTGYRFRGLSSDEPLDGPAFRDHDLFAVSYDAFRRMKDDLAAYPFDLLVIDESHMLKNRTTARTKAVFEVAGRFPCVIELSGTPVTNRLTDLWAQLSVLHPEKVGSYWSFGSKYCGLRNGSIPIGDGRTRTVAQETGKQDYEGLRKLTEDMILRYEKADILPWLPPKILVDRPVKLEKSKRREYEVAEEDFIEWLRSFKGDLKKETANVLEQLNALRQITSAGKLWAAEEAIEEATEGDRKTIVFSVYNAPLEALKAKLGDAAVILTGKVDEEGRKEAVDRFMEDPGCKVFLGGLKAAGAGLTLTAASSVVFLDFSWVPSDHEQGLNRIHRPGQEASSVRILQLFAPDTIDGRMAEILKRKKQMISMAIDGRPLPKEDNVVNDLIESYLN